jgi:hypothetical protein
MKTAIKIFITLVALLYGLVSNAATKASQADTLDFIVNGLILQKNKKINQTCKLELFYENTKVDSVLIRFNKPFEYTFKKNVWYTIRVSKEGFVPILISFNTEMKDQEKVKDNFFAFETELIDLEQAKYLNRDELDFPVGLVTFNTETKKFGARDIYTTNHYVSLYNPDEIQNDVDIVKENVTKRHYNSEMC